MPKLPGLSNYSMGGAPQAQLLPSPESIAVPVERSAGIAMQQANIPNPLQQGGAFGGAVAEQLYNVEQQQQKKEDAIARSMARTQYFQEADQLFSDAETSDITSKAGFTALTKNLDELKQKTLANYSGSDDGRAALAMQLDDAHADYGRRAIMARGKAVQTQFQGEFDATTNRLSSILYDTPSLLNDMLKAGDAWIDDVTPAISPQEANTRRAEMRGVLAFSAIDGLLNNGDYREADMLARTAGPMLTPQQQGAIDRRVRGLAADAARQQGQGTELKSAGEGILYRPDTGEMYPPPSSVQEYMRGLKEAGRTSVSQTMSPGETEYDKERGKQFAEEMKKYQEDARTSNEDLRTAQNVDKMLENIPTGTLPAEIRKRFNQATGLNVDELSTVQAAESETGKFLFNKIRLLAPVTDTDKRYILNISPGFAQTPLGRKTIVYLYQRNAMFNQNMAEFSQKIDKQIAAKNLTRQDASILISRWRDQLTSQYTQSFNPPAKVR